VSGLWVIASLTFREAARRRILALAFFLGVAFLALYTLALHLLLPDLPSNVLMRGQIFKTLLLLGLYAVNFLTVMMSVLTSVDTLAGEIRSGTIQTVVSKPVARWEVVLGKWLGFVGMLTVYVLLMSGGVAGAVYSYVGFSTGALAVAIGLMWLEGLVLLSITFLGGTMLSTLATGVLAIGLHGLAFLGGWIEEFGSYFESKTPASIGIVSSLIMPSEAMWRRAAYEIQKPILGRGGMGPFSGGAVPSDWMVAYAVVYTLVALALAVRVFSKRDL
jgi:ABC-type transport system involved in multi-copper enzyme maturation permease subunit